MKFKFTSIFQMRLTSFTTPTLFKSDIIMMIFPTNSALRNFHKHKGLYM